MVAAVRSRLYSCNYNSSSVKQYSILTGNEVSLLDYLPYPGPFRDKRRSGRIGDVFALGVQHMRWSRLVLVVVHSWFG